MASKREVRRILAVGAHPDDIEFGCGGILLKAAEEGAEIALLLCSRGESGTNGSPEERESEARAAASMLGASLDFIDLGGDAMMTYTKEAAVAFARELRERRPDILLAPSKVENQHPDHAVVGRLAAEAARLARYGGLKPLRGVSPHGVGNALHFAISPSGEPHSVRPLLIDISAQEERWTNLMACHASQLKTRRYVDLQLARARAWGLQAGVSMAQALWSEDCLLFDSVNSLPQSARSF